MSTTNAGASSSTLMLPAESMNELKGGGDEELLNKKEPVSFRNPFVNKQLIYQGLIKTGIHFAMISIAVSFDKKYSNFVSSPMHVKLNFEMRKIGQVIWRDEIQLSLREFTNKIREFQIELKDFMNTPGFTYWQKKILFKYFEKYLTIRESKLAVRTQKPEKTQFTSKQKIQIKSNPLCNVINRMRMLRIVNLPYYDFDPDMTSAP
eukprot:CAMPEP_0114579972 /NCGR_PEP_ID=MMETSP0125-20121206/4303_1 /TAXON_ID=485358 ORGANISM="Aristerostoma sp., Strain ATCC 50986" /NCGR_SAMPLE_ID=MMETSP0125 /ASSEMBLY_ACC=CAM_ASM_000245 /LENGTH=205 /DNA_ID=CAMNT_0001771159 /DNA_START=972 /DNA_END=1589 /DNA_ORIENTATION=+